MVEFIYKFIIFVRTKFQGNILLRVLNQRIPDSGEWGGGKEFNDMIKNNGAKTVRLGEVKIVLLTVDTAGDVQTAQEYATSGGGGGWQDCGRDRQGRRD